MPGDADRPRPPAPPTRRAGPAPATPAPAPGRSATLLLSVGAVVVLFPLYMTVVNSLLDAGPDRPASRRCSSRSTPSGAPTPWPGARGTSASTCATRLIQTAIIVVGQLVTSVLAAYAFAFLRFPFRRTLFVVFLATLMIPFEVTFITNLDTINSLGWYNTFAGLTVPFLATGFGTFLLRQAFLQIPKDLQEAAPSTATATGGSWSGWRCPWPARSVAALGGVLLPGRLEPVPLAPAGDRRQQQRRARSRSA